MKKILTILFTFAIFTIWHYEVHITLAPDDAMRSHNLKRTEISEKLVGWTEYGLFLHVSPAHMRNSSWYKFIPHNQIVAVERKDE